MWSGIWSVLITWIGFWSWVWSTRHWIVALTLSVFLKLPPRKLEFNEVSPEVAVYLYKSAICLCMKYCCHVWAGAPIYYLELLGKLQKQICRTIGPSLAASLEPLAHYRNLASLSLFYRYCCGRFSSELTQLVPLLFLEGGLLVILIDCLIFLSPLLEVTIMSKSTFSVYRMLSFDLWSKWP